MGSVKAKKIGGSQSELIPDCNEFWRSDGHPRPREMNGETYRSDPPRTKYANLLSASCQAPPLPLCGPLFVGWALRRHSTF